MGEHSSLRKQLAEHSDDKWIMMAAATLDNLGHFRWCRSLIGIGDAGCRECGDCGDVLFASRPRACLFDKPLRHGQAEQFARWSWVDDDHNKDAPAMYAATLVDHPCAAISPSRS
jgi:hypothetical protein